jgi:hypothetical protein
MTLSALTTTFGIGAAIAPLSENESESPIEVVGRERPLFLGSTVVTASALPE